MLKPFLPPPNSPAADPMLDAEVDDEAVWECLCVKRVLDVPIVVVVETDVSVP